MKILELSFNILLAFSISFSILFLIFKTDVIVSYLCLFGYDDSEYRTTLGLGSFPEFIRYKQRNFFTKLVSCPYCLGFWICLASSFIASVSFCFPIVYTLFVFAWRKIDE